MKKLVLFTSLLLVLSNVCFAEYGFGVKLGIGENNPQTMEDIFNDIGGTLEKSGGIFALEALYEAPFSPGDEVKKLGLKVGMDFYGENKITSRDGYSYLTGTETTYAFPITAYYKYDAGINKVSFWGGAGLTFIRTEVEVVDSWSKNKLFPHISGGAEYRFSDLFALGLDLKYNFNAEVKDDDSVLSDRSGLSGALVLRFYYGPPVNKYEGVKQKTKKERYNNGRHYYEYY